MTIRNLPLFVLLHLAAVLQLSAQSDNSPPVLTDFTISESCIDVSNNSVDVVFTAHLLDGLSGVANVSLTYLTPNSSSSSYAMCLVSGNSNNGIYEVTVSYDNTFIAGEYIYGLFVTDNAGNFLSMSHYNRDLLNVGFQDSLKLINVFSDAVPPTLTDFTISETCVDVFSTPADVTFTTDISDDNSGIAQVSLLYLTPTNSSSSYTMNLVAGDNLNGTYEAIVNYDNLDPAGVYFYGIFTTDNFGNFLNLSPFNRDLMNLGYQDSLKVTNSSADTDAPTLVDFSISESCIDVSSNTVNVQFTAHVQDVGTGVNQVDLQYLTPNGTGSSIVLSLISGNALDGMYSGSITYDNSYVEGTYLFGLFIADIAGNFTSYNYFNRDLMNAGFQDEVVLLNCPMGVETQMQVLRISNHMHGLVHKIGPQNCMRTTIDNNGILQSTNAPCNPLDSDLCIDCGNLYFNTTTPQLILTSPNGQCWNVIPDSNGLLQSLPIACPTNPDVDIQNGDLIFGYRPAGKTGPILKTNNTTCWQLSMDNQNQLSVQSINCP